MTTARPLRAGGGPPFNERGLSRNAAAYVHVASRGWHSGSLPAAHHQRGAARKDVHGIIRMSA